MPLARIALIATAALAALGLAVLPRALVVDPATPNAPAGLGERDMAEAGRMIRTYLTQNPEILREMANALQAKEGQAADAQRSAALIEHRDTIFNSPRQVVLGNPDGDVTVVEFFDYNCGYCKRALPDMTAMIQADPKLRFVLKELPVLGEGSRDAARVAVAVHKQAPEKYLAFHQALPGSSQPATGERALAAAATAGLDMARLSADLADPVVDATLEETQALAQQLRIDGTPSYVVADRIVPGAVGLAALKSLISNARACGKAVCS